MLGKAKKATPNAAMSAETSGCANKEGFLKKKNSKGEWKDRYCYFTNNFFLTYKPKGNGPSSELKESVDLKNLKNVNVQMDVLTIELTSGEKMEFKGSMSDINEWVDIMNERQAWATGRPKSNSVDSGSDRGRSNSQSQVMPAFPPLEGYLYKKNSKGEWKKRFCACKPHAFVGYKEKDNEIKENIDYRDIIRVTVGKNEKGKPTIEIEVKQGEKIIFQADRAKDWADGLEMRSDWAAQFAPPPPQSPSISGSSPHSPSKGGMLSSSSKDNQQSSVVAELVSMEGMMKKKNSAGVWKDRYAMFEKHFFKTFKPKNNKPTTEIKENIDLKEIEQVRCLNNDTMEIELKQGKTMLFQSPKVQEWVRVIQSRTAYVVKEYESKLQENIMNTIHIEGWLLKKSHNKYQGLQERYIRVEGMSFKYYKDLDSLDKELGNIDLTKADFVRAFDDSDECLVFEVHDEGDKTYKFQCQSHKEMCHWVQTIDKIMIAYREKVENDIKTKLVEETPIRIRWYDDNGEEYLITEIQADFESMYPEDPNGELTIGGHLNCANEIVGYLTDFVPETQRCDQRPARYDVLALMLTEVNNFLSKRLLTFLPLSDNELERGYLIENANLGDLHALLNFITQYQQTLKGIRCPVFNSGTTSGSAKTNTAILSTKYLTPKQCAVFDTIPMICRLYVYGGSTGAKGGAAHHLYDHCVKVWNNCIANPEEMLQKRNDGTFFTHTPIDMWESINLHISLATSTRTPILHVMIADKVVSSLNDVFNMMIKYINTVDSSTVPTLKEVELEFFCALANDTALHIEEVMNLIEQFDIDEIRQRIDDIFDPLTTNLVNCGQACLKRLGRLVMSDVQELLDEVFMPDWMEGNQMHVATATITDYMNDFEEYLVQFWAEKFLNTILEEVIVCYTRSLLFRNGNNMKMIAASASTMTPPPSSPAQSGGGGGGGFMSSFFQKTKQVAQTIATTTTMVSVPAHVPVDGESLGRLAQDVNILNSFFSTKAGQELATEFLVILNEVSLLLFVDMDGLIAHMQKCEAEFPSALPAVREVAIAAMKMRYEEFSKQDIDVFAQKVAPLLTTAIQDAAKMEEDEVAEGKLGLLYMEVCPKELLKQSQDKLSLSQRAKLMSNVHLGHSNRKTRREDDENDNEDNIDEPDLTAQLVDEVMGVLQQRDEEDDAFLQEREEAEREKELQKSKIGILKYDGDLEKKSPAHNLWQKRYFKLMTKNTGMDENPYIYSFMWYKKEGGAVIKSLDIDHIQGLAVVQTQRPLSYVPMHKNPLMLKHDAGSDPTAVSITPLEALDTNTGGKAQVGLETYIFSVIQTDGKEHILKTNKLDRMLKWINIISLAGGLAYNPKTKHWDREMLPIYEAQAEERKRVQSFHNVSSATPLAPFAGGSPRGRSTSQDEDHTASAVLDDPAALIASAKSSLLQEQREKERLEEEARERERLEQERIEAEEEERRREEEEAERFRQMRLQEEEEAREREREKEREKERERIRKEEEEKEKERAKQQASAQSQVTSSVNPIAKKAANSMDNPLLKKTPPPPPPPPTAGASPKVSTPPPPAQSPATPSVSSSEASPATSGGAGKVSLLKKRVITKHRRASNAGGIAVSTGDNEGAETDSAATVAANSTSTAGEEEDTILVPAAAAAAAFKPPPPPLAASTAKAIPPPPPPAFATATTKPQPPPVAASSPASGPKPAPPAPTAATSAPAPVPAPVVEPAKPAAPASSLKETMKKAAELKSAIAKGSFEEDGDKDDSEGEGDDDSSAGAASDDESEDEQPSKQQPVSAPSSPKPAAVATPSPKTASPAPSPSAKPAATPAPAPIAAPSPVRPPVSPKEDKVAAKEEDNSAKEDDEDDNSSAGAGSDDDDDDDNVGDKGEEGETAEGDAEVPKKKVRSPDDKTPLRVQWYEDEGEQYFEEQLESELEKVFPDPDQAENEMTIREQLSLAREVVSYLSNLLSTDCRYVNETGGNVIRYDVLSSVLHTVNSFLSRRLSPSLSSSSTGASSASSLFDEASMTDILAVIDFLTEYQSLLQDIHCPIEADPNEAEDDDGDNGEVHYTNTHFSPKSCTLIEQTLPSLCKVFVNGGTAGTRGGVGGQISDASLKVWQAIVASPESALTRDPRDNTLTLGLSLWDVIDNFVTMTKGRASTMLYAMVMDKVITVVTQCFDVISSYVHMADLSKQAVGTRVQLLVAVMNDSERHSVFWEDCLNKHFSSSSASSSSSEDLRKKYATQIEQIATKIKAMGAIAAKRLPTLMVTNDTAIVSLFEKVFMPTWLDVGDDDDSGDEGEGGGEGQGGDTTRKALQILSTNVKLCEEGFLAHSTMKERVMTTISEETVILFMKSLLFRRNVSNPPPSNQKTGFFSGMYQKAKQALLPPHVHVDSESLGRLAQDVNALNTFFMKHGNSAELATELLSVLNEVSFMFVVDFNGLTAFIQQTAKSSPSAVASVKEITLSIMRMRSNDFVKTDIDKFTQAVQASLSIAASETTGKQGGESRGAYIYNRVVKG